MSEITLSGDATLPYLTESSDLDETLMWKGNIEADRFGISVPPFFLVVFNGFSLLLGTVNAGNKGDKIHKLLSECSGIQDLEEEKEFLYLRESFPVYI